MTDFVVRGIRAGEWEAVKALRLVALRDAAAGMAFLETYEDAVGRADSFWQERAVGAGEEGTGARQFVAETVDGEWVGTVTVLVEEAGSTDWAGFPVARRQGHVVGVYVRPEWRGGAVIGGLFEAAVEWAWGAGAERVRLLVDERNLRARAAYRKVGFLPSGVRVTLDSAEDETELELELER